MDNYDNEFVVSRFNRLMKDVMTGNWQRTSFEPWEITLLLDIQACSGEMKGRRDLLVRYQKAVQRRMSQRREMPMLLSDYIRQLNDRQAARNGSRESSTELAAALS